MAPTQNAIKDSLRSSPCRQHAALGNLRAHRRLTMTTQTYQQASQQFLAQANQELAAGDLPQASEKGWGATVQMLKAVAEQRGWEHSRHRHHLVTVSRLRAETGDGDIRRLFNTASALHENFYENTMSAEDIAESLDDVQALLDRIETLLKQGSTTKPSRKP